MKSEEELKEEIENLLEDKLEAGLEPVLVRWCASGIVEMYDYKDDWEDYRQGLESHEGDISNYVEFLQLTDLDKAKVSGFTVYNRD